LIRRVLALSLLVGALVLSLQPAAARLRGCGPSTSAGAAIVAQDDRAVVFSKHGRLYGCLFYVGRSKRLATQKRSERINARSIVLAGHFAGYDTLGGRTATRVIVYDIRRGHIARSERPRSAGTRKVDVTRLVLRGNGSFAWIATAAGEDPEVHSVEIFEGGHNRLLDSASGIDPLSLALSEDRRTLFWRRSTGPRFVNFD